MADDLDDLFGAFDGEDDAENDEPSDQIKSSPSHEKGASKEAAKGIDHDEEGNAGEEEEEPEAEATATSTGVDDDERDGGGSETVAAASDGQTPLGDAELSESSTQRQRPPTKTDSTVSAKSYTDVMSRPTAAHSKKAVDGNGVTDKGPPDETKKKEVNLEVSTGTSHDKSIRSYSAVPDNYHPSEPPASAEAPKEPAKTYPFPLDPFQSTAVSYIDRNESVLVAAHTSAGKTAVAEYAVAKSLRDGQRVIYTSPIKALSNQKYRDLQEEFEDVGLMTGDITINPTATALVMTTEILRSMLYRGSEVMREVAWVIYDEVHYMRDKERGVVWEESIILLPHKVRFVFLSATIPNASQFVDWICKVHHQPCHVVYTNYRPVPLQHYIFPEGGDGLHLVVDERGKFREGNFQRAMATLQSGSGSDAAAAKAMLQSGNAKGRGGAGQKRKRSFGGGSSRRGQSSGLHRIVKLVMDRGLNPVIVFSFSKKDCERYALELNREDYTDDVEKDLIAQVYTNAIEGLGEDDRKLPQVEALLPLLKRGIGIHHGGLLPILKEIVEILFSEGLIKALFATETFAIGINMPAKTVVFTNTRKWDGRDFRWLTSGEYIQMSGRAGRRGKDDRGIVIQMMDEKMEPDVCKGVLYGDPDPLNSSYRISYNMLLNMMRVEDVDPEYLLRASFHQYQQESEAPALEARAKELEVEAKEVVVGDGSREAEERIAEYYQMDQQLAGTKRKMTRIVRRPEHIMPFVQAPGRLLDISIDGESFGWGTLVSYRRRTATSGGEAGRLASRSGPTHSLDVLLPCVDRHFDSVDDEQVKEEDLKDQPLLWRGSARNCRPATSDDDPKVVSPRIFTVGLEAIERISAVRIYIPQDVIRPEPRETVSKSVKEVKRRFPEGLPLLDPVKDLGIKGDEFAKLLGRAEELASRLADHPLAKDTTEDERIRQVRSYGRKAELLAQARAVASEARSCQTMVMKDDLKKMKRVLKKLGHVDARGVIQTKGRTACEINTSDELVAVELMFGGVFNDLSVEQSVALLSCMTFDEKVADDDDPAGGLKSYLANPLHKLKESARVVAKAAIECKVELDEDEFVEKFNPGMMEAVFAWCKGAKFIDVQKLTGSFEGTTIRTLRRLEELVRQLTSASKAIGNHELQAKFEKGSELLKRDIVFCSSLYL